MYVPDEIVVVNDHGDPALKDVLRALPKKCRIVYAYIREDVGFGYNHACNLGVWLARNGLITIEDADHIPMREAYGRGRAIFSRDLSLGRISYTRNWVPIADVLDKPREEWKPYGYLGPNAMVAMYRRDVYTMVKGQDERMNEYGWLAYDWKASERKIGTKVHKLHGFYIVKDGSEDNIDRSMSKKNRKIYRDNANREHYNGTEGILNFSYDVDLL